MDLVLKQMEANWLFSTELGRSIKPQDRIHASTFTYNLEKCKIAPSQESDRLEGVL